jgi:hypothetical protein
MSLETKLIEALERVADLERERSDLLLRIERADFRNGELESANNTLQNWHRENLSKIQSLEQQIAQMNPHR